MRRLRPTVSSVHGFLYEDWSAYAVYHALLQRDHPATVVDMAVSFASWADQATAAATKFSERSLEQEALRTVEFVSAHDNRVEEHLR